MEFTTRSETDEWQRKRRMIHVNRRSRFERGKKSDFGKRRNSSYSRYASRTTSYRIVHRLRPAWKLKLEEARSVDGSPRVVLTFQQVFLFPSFLSSFPSFSPFSPNSSPTFSSNFSSTFSLLSAWILFLNVQGRRSERFSRRLVYLESGPDYFARYITPKRNLHDGRGAKTRFRSKNEFVVWR